MDMEYDHSRESCYERQELLNRMIIGNEFVKDADRYDQLINQISQKENEIEIAELKLKIQEVELEKLEIQLEYLVNKDRL